MFSRYLCKNNVSLLIMIVSVAYVFIAGCMQKKPKVYRVGILSGLDYFAITADAFRSKMTELGYVEGKNIIYDMQRTNFEPEKEQQILRKFVEDKVDLIVTFPTEVSLAAKSVTEGTSVPVVFANAFTDGNGLIQSIREPGGNITGVRWPGPDMTLKSFEILVEFMPHTKRVWISYLKNYPSGPSQMAVLRTAAAKAGITLIEVPVTNFAEVRADLLERDKLADIDIDAALMISDPLLGTPAMASEIVGFWNRHKVPMVGPVTEGGIFGMLPDVAGAGTMAAPIADKILKGVPAGTIPVVSPNAKLIVNYSAFQAIDLPIPEGLLNRADEIIR
jgi:putative ABC transport system substrate-binding protein